MWSLVELFIHFLDELMGPNGKIVDTVINVKVLK